METLIAELERRWREMFTALADGDDVPPSQRLRAEGMLEAAALLDPSAMSALAQSMDDCYGTAFGRDIATDFGEQWQDFFPFPQIPAMGKRAPVYPSTKD